MNIMQHGFQLKPHSHTPNLTSRPKLPPSSMMASSNPTLQVLIYEGFIIMLASWNHLTTSVLTKCLTLLNLEKLRLKP